jgi:hypothetical protein
VFFWGSVRFSVGFFSEIVSGCSFGGFSIIITRFSEDRVTGCRVRGWVGVVLGWLKTAPFTGVETFVLDEEDEDTNKCGFFCF